ncbi:MAG: thioredoxin domain-containing protein [Sphingomicrobium sp.]
MLRFAFLPLTALSLSAPLTARTAATDWSKVVRATPSGGFVMGSPAARAKLIEYGSLTCPHCAHFDADGAPALVADYVRGGRVSWEFRSFLLNGVDVPATLAANCAGPGRFFPVVHSFYASQRDWVGKVQALSEDRMAAIQKMSQPQQFLAIGDAAGLSTLAAAQGIPVATTQACLADGAAAKRAVAVTQNAVTRLQVSGTPTFIINGIKVDTSTGPSVWAVVKARLDAALKR